MRTRPLPIMIDRLSTSSLARLLVLLRYVLRRHGLCATRCPFFFDKFSARQPIRSFEAPVRYLPGQQYRWHYDLIHPSLLEPYRDQRLALLVYLDDVPTEGTAFRDLRGSGSDAAIGRQLEVQQARAGSAFPEQVRCRADFRASSGACS